MIAEDVIGNKKMTDDAGNNFSSMLNFNSGGWNSDFVTSHRMQLLMLASLSGARIK